jgi:hypothetical protein
MVDVFNVAMDVRFFATFCFFTARFTDASSPGNNVRYKPRFDNL